MSEKNFLRIWFFGLLVKLIFSAWLPLFSDETYYWVWSHHLQLSYYDHPPFIAWLIRLGHFFEPFANAVRWPAVVFSHSALFIWYSLLRNHLSAKRLQLWFLLAFITPMTGMGSIILTPDLPLVFFWSLALLSLERITNSTSTTNWRWYLSLGLSLGLGFCSKYHMVLFLPIAFLWLLLSQLWKVLDPKKTLFAVLIALLCCSPVLIWNWQNDWISFKFQLNHGLGGVWKPKYTWRYVYGQIALIFPTIWFCSWQARKTKTLSWLPYFAYAPLLFFLFSSFKGKVEANWTSIAYPSLIALAMFSTDKDHWLRWTKNLWFACAIIICTHIAYPWLPFDHKKLKTHELVAYQPYAKIATSYKPFYAPTFQLASKVWYELKMPTFKLHGMGRIDFYDHLPGSKPNAKTYFFAGENWNSLPDWAIQRGDRVVNKYPVDAKNMLFEVSSP